MLLSVFAFAIQQSSGVGGEWEMKHFFSPSIGAPIMLAETRPTVAVGDIDLDGVADFAFTASGSSSFPGLFVMSGKSGQEIWRFDYSTQLAMNQGPDGLLNLVDDIDGDGFRDLVAGDRWAVTSMGQQYSGFVAVHSGRNGGLLWFVDDDQLGERLGDSAAGVGDQNGDGVSDLAVTTGGSLSGGWTSAIHVLSGVDGSLLSSITSASSFPIFQGLAERDSLVDIDHDGMLDVIVQVAASQLDVYSIATSQVLVSYVDSNILNGSGNTVSLAVPDSTGDGVSDLVLPVESTSTHGFHLLNRMTGQEVWRRTLPGDYVAELDLGADWDGDGIRDIAVGLPDKRVSVFPQEHGVVDLRKGSNGKLIRRLEVGVLGVAGEDGFGAGVTFDDQSEYLFVRELSALNFGESPPLICLEFSRYLEGDLSTVSAASGGQVTFSVSFPSSFAGSLYSIGVSAAGTGPTILNGLEIPLAVDRWLLASWSDTLPPAFAYRTGTLDAEGNATAYLGFPPGVLATAVGSSFWLAAVAADSPSLPTASSAVWRIDVVP